MSKISDQEQIQWQYLRLQEPVHACNEPSRHLSAESGVFRVPDRANQDEGGRDNQVGSVTTTVRPLSAFCLNTYASLSPELSHSREGPGVLRNF